MTISANYPSVIPSLSLDFANSGVLDNRITFTRSTTGTYYNGYSSAVAEQNLLTYSQDFTNALWVKLSTTVTGNSTTAPDGTTTSNLITATAGASGHDVSQVNTTISANTASTYSVYLKAGTYGFANIVMNGASSTGWYAITVNLTTGAITQTGAGAIGTYTSSSITSVGSSWYRVTLTGQMTQASNSVNVYLASSATPTYGGYGVDSWTAVGTETIYAWGAQLEQRSAVTAYNATTTTAITNYIPVLQTGAINQARFDHNPTTGESLGLLIEEQRTNLVLQSAFASVWTNTNTSSSLSANIAPDGTQTAIKLVENSGLAYHNIQQSVSVTTPTFSLYAKAGERSQIAIFVGGASVGVGFDLTNGTVISISGYTSGSATSTITSVGNGWYRCAIAFAGTASFFQIGMASGSTGNYTGNGYSGVYIWGAQAEAGAFATSYIPTVASQVTRSADLASMTGTNFSSWYNQSQGTLYAETVDGSVGSGGMCSIYSDASNAFSFRSSGTANTTRLLVKINGSYVVNVTTNATTQPIKQAAALISGSISASYNSSLFITNNTSSMPYSMTTLGIGYDVTSGTAYANSCIKKLAYYPIRVTNAQLQALTGS